jgi:hypothetical protein
MELEEDMLCRSDAVGFVLMQWGGGGKGSAAALALGQRR